MCGHGGAIDQEAAGSQAGVSRERPYWCQEHQQLQTHHRRSQSAVQYGTVALRPTVSSMSFYLGSQISRCCFIIMGLSAHTLWYVTGESLYLYVNKQRFKYYLPKTKCSY